MNSNGFFNYMSENSHNSLFRNGKVLTKRDINGSDAGSLGIDLKKVEMPVINARDQLGKKKIYLDKNGFEIIPSNINHITTVILEHAGGRFYRGRKKSYT